MTQLRIRNERVERLKAEERHFWRQLKDPWKESEKKTHEISGRRFRSQHSSGVPRRVQPRPLVVRTNIPKQNNDGKIQNTHDHQREGERSDS